MLLPHATHLHPQPLSHTPSPAPTRNTTGLPGCLLPNARTMSDRALAGVEPSSRTKATPALVSAADTRSSMPAGQDKKFVIFSLAVRNNCKLLIDYLLMLCSASDTRSSIPARAVGHKVSWVSVSHLLQ